MKQKLQKYYLLGSGVLFIISCISIVSMMLTKQKSGIKEVTLDHATKLTQVLAKVRVANTELLLAGYKLQNENDEPVIEELDFFEADAIDESVESNGGDDGNQGVPETSRPHLNNGLSNSEVVKSALKKSLEINIKQDEVTIQYFTGHTFLDVNGLESNEFAKKAWKQLNNWEGEINRYYSVNEQTGVMSLASSDFLRGKDLVEFLNEHYADEASGGWSLGDVLGIIVVEIPANSAVSAKEGRGIFLLIVAACCFFCLLFIILLRARIKDFISNEMVLNNSLKEAENRIVDKEKELVLAEEKLERGEQNSARNIKFSGLIQKHNEIGELLESMINDLAQELEACHGAIFIAESTKNKVKFRFSSGYAYHIAESETVEFELGEGLIGQVAKDKKILNLVDVPNDFVQVLSGLGKSAPSHVLIVPIQYGGEVLAVIELASFNTFSDDDISFFKTFSESLGAKISIL